MDQNIKCLIEKELVLLSAQTTRWLKTTMRRSLREKGEGGFGEQNAAKREENYLSTAPNIKWIKVNILPFLLKQSGNIWVSDDFMENRSELVHLNSLSIRSNIWQWSKMEFFIKIVNSWQPFTIFTKSSILDVPLDFESASAATGVGQLSWIPFKNTVGGC